MSDASSSRLRGLTAPNALKVELVSAYSGDRAMTTSERAELDLRMRERGTAFFSDLMYAITHVYFAPELAKTLWVEVLRHKLEISSLLGRNVRVTVAALDYLSNVTDEMISPTVISEAHAVEIVNLSMRDGMTGLYNHTSFYELLNVELKHHRRYGSRLALVLLDIDDFKRINDQFGHLEGDRILVALADTLTKHVRESDLCCRFGGEEFVVILPFTPRIEEAVEVAERIRMNVGAIPCGDSTISVSAGVALSNIESRSGQALIEEADRALYRAKRDGKNRIAVAGACGP